MRRCLSDPGDSGRGHERSPTYVAQIINRVTSPSTSGERDVPNYFTKGAHQATLDPLARKGLKVGLFMWSDNGSPGVRHSGNPNFTQLLQPLLCSRTTGPLYRGTGASVSTPGPKASLSGVYLVACLLVLLWRSQRQRHALVMGHPSCQVCFYAPPACCCFGTWNSRSVFIPSYTKPQGAVGLVKGAFHHRGLHACAPASLHRHWGLVGRGFNRA